MAVLLSLSSAAAEAQPDGGDQFGNEVKDLERIGFQLFADGSRVFVETTEPTRYTIDNTRRGVVVLTLQNTRVPLRNNRRVLDTRFFNSPVRRVKATVIEGQGSTTRVEIYLRRRTPYKEVQNDTFLALDFRH